jgi:hypothetical protein
MVFDLKLEKSRLESTQLPSLITCMDSELLSQSLHRFVKKRGHDKLIMLTSRTIGRLELLDSIEPNAIRVEIAVLVWGLVNRRSGEGIGNIRDPSVAQMSATALACATPKGVSSGSARC